MHLGHRIRDRFGRSPKDGATDVNLDDVEYSTDPVAGSSETTIGTESKEFDPFEDLSSSIDDITPNLPEPPSLYVKTGTASEKGNHARNEDCALAGWWCGCFALSDGIGGAPDGDYMSRVSCGAALEDYEENRSLAKAFSAGNAAALKVSKWIGNPDCGATLLLGSLEGPKMHFAWVGDSLAYRMRDGALYKITEEQRAEGSNALLSAIGYDLGIVPQETECDIVPGDRILMCSDGVWCAYEETGRISELVELLSAETDNLLLLATQIVRTARNQWHDDATAIVLEFTDKPVVRAADNPVEEYIEKTPPLLPVDETIPLPKAIKGDESENATTLGKTEEPPVIDEPEAVM